MELTSELVRTKIILRKGKEAPVLRGHLWIFSGAVYKMIGKPKAGDWVDVYDWKDQFLGAGHYQKSSICVRLLSNNQSLNTKEILEAKLANALAYRKELGLIDNSKTNAFRLIHGEGDGLPGLIIDIYANAAIIQPHSFGMELAVEEIKSALIAVMPHQFETIYVKHPVNRKKEMTDQFLLGKEGQQVILENDYRFNVNFETGQKTGFFLDQRENRNYLGTISKGKSVLNAFSYSGGFSVYALGGGASFVHSVDVSEKAIVLANENVALNNFEKNHTAYSEDVLKFLRASNEAYDVVVLDPPAYAKNMKARHQAVQGYKRLNAEGLKKVKSGGTLMTFSCSQVVDEVLFKNTIVAAGLEAKRNIRIVRKLGQAPDHPVNLFHPEGTYLKGLVLYVE